MKNNYSREWLENYKTIPKRDNAIYKNYQNPGMSSWDRQMASLSSAQKNRYNEFLNTIPNELQGLSAAEMQKYLQETNQKQNALTQEKATYENQIQNLKNQQESRRLAELETIQMKRPYYAAAGNLTGGFARQAKYTDTHAQVPFNLLLKTMRNQGVSDPKEYARYYHGHGKTNDPYRPFEMRQGSNYNLIPAYINPGNRFEQVPPSIFEKYLQERNLKTFRSWEPPNNI
jgi:hypothetical protein